MKGGAAVEAIVLAAGRARRMGEAKHLLQVGGAPMLLRVVRALEEAGVRGVTVVLRQTDEAAAALLRGTSARIARVDAAGEQEGRAASIRAGLAALPADGAAVLFAMADQPLLEAGDFARLLAALDPAGEQIACAHYGGERGTPVLFPARYREELLALAGKQGGREVIARHPERLRGVELDPARGLDLDRPEDLAAARER